MGERDLNRLNRWAISRGLLVASAITIASVVILPATAKAQKDLPNPLAASLRTTFAAARQNLLDATSDVPSDLFAFKAMPDVRTYGEIVGHLVNGNFSFCAAALSDKNPNSMDWQTVTDSTKLASAMKSALEFCDGIYARVRDAQLREMIPVRFGANGRAQSGLTHGEQQMPRLAPLVTNIEHDFEHYGNLVTYMRLKGIVPPSTRRQATGPRQ
jgi:uncharacterized damage-inducible protein DinB